MITMIFDMANYLTTEFHGVFTEFHGFV
jgi:hypothetical protein